MKTTYKTIILLAALLFICINVYLIVKENSKVERTLFVSKWSSVKKENLTKSFHTSGVIKPNNEYPVYFNGGNGKEFQKFLVEEGDEVSAGTALFQYTSPEADRIKKNLEAEKSQAAGDMNGIDAYISKLESYKETITADMPVTDENADINKNLNLASDASNQAILSAIEQEIYKQELEKTKLESQMKRFDEQLAFMDEQSNTAAAASQADGFVKKINKHLKNPILTIASKTPSVEGMLSEKEFRMAKTGMIMTIKTSELKRPLKGTIVKINPYPVKEPSVHSKNSYRFKGSIKETQRELPIGSNVALTVTAKNAKRVSAIEEEAVHVKKQPHVYKINPKGYINNQYVELGLRSQGKQEIKSGLTAGEFAVVSPCKTPQDHSLFITPLLVSENGAPDYKKIAKHLTIRYLLTGFLEK
ncbi:HlyD family secretion protein [Bacillus sp. OV322]|uniref:efflux RND transporter periplasmic adaptor subunit n=1 Tax=Bacillus sp. OV322 TaxID=1882764 RepID=UPI0008E59A1D|nr:efflux RND transporter periplasmic adaptor subunit [Bacillus sp. OV322]SFC97121.1 HlyD family secretion protein [Bacillus sp. OV322]